MFSALFHTSVLVHPSSTQTGLPSSADLVERLRDGDPAASRELWDTQITRVRGIVWRTVGRNADVDDLVQEVFIGVLKGIHRLKNADALDAFVVGVTTNVCRYALRKRARRREVEDTYQNEPAQHLVQADPDARRALVRLRDVLSRLSPELHVAFVLRHAEGLNLNEVADAMGWSLATTKRRLRKARTIVLAQAERDPLLAPYIDGGPS